MNRASLPPECDRMPRGLLIAHLGVDMTEVYPRDPAPVGPVIASLQAEVDRQRAADAAADRRAVA